ncbi:hypothetical protein AtNW77_Chr5g0119721 [Arabidopsis thaliana]
MSQALLNFQLSSSSSFSIPKTLIHSHSLKTLKTPKLNSRQFFSQCTASSSDGPKTLRTCKNCKTQFDPLLNNPRACRFHTAHFGGGTMDTPNSGKVLQYWHCCGSEDPFDSGCTASPHTTYDD